MKREREKERGSERIKYECERGSKNCGQCPSTHFSKKHDDDAFRLYNNIILFATQYPESFTIHIIRRRRDGCL